MHISRIRLYRRSLIGLIVVVSLAVLINYAQSWRRRRDIIKPSAQILSPELLRSAINLTYTEHENGGTKLQLHAEKLLETREGEEILEGIEANDLNPDGSIRNRIRSRLGSYDTKGKQISFSGDVRLDFGKDVELRMETLHYNINEQKGDSDDRLRLVSPQATGTAKGVRYDNANKTLELLSELAFVLHRRVVKPGGPPQVEDYRLSARHGYYSEVEHTVRLTGAASLATAAGTLSGDRIEATFSADARRLTGLVCEGQATYQSQELTNVRTLQGERIEFGIGPESQALESIRVRDHALFAVRSDSGDQTMSASVIDLEMDPVRNMPRRIVSQSGVTFEFVRDSQKTTVTGDWLDADFTPGGSTLEAMHVRDHAIMRIGSGAAAPDELQAEEIRVSFRNLEGRSAPLDLKADRSVKLTFAGRAAGKGSAAEPGRILTAAALTMHYSKAGDLFESGTASGSVTLAVLPVPGVQNDQLRRLQCDRIDFGFFPGENRLQTLAGDGHVQVFYQKAAAEEFRTSSSSIRAQFRRADGGVETVTQSGGFVYQDGTRTARSGVCNFAAATDLLVLNDHPSIDDPGSTTTGDVVEYDRRQKVLSVHRNVQSTLKSASAKSQGPLTSSADSGSPSIVIADEMQYWIAQKKVRYGGTVNLLSAESHLQARSLEITNLGEGAGESVDAQGEVRHLVLGLKEGGLTGAAKDGKTKAADGKEKQQTKSGRARIVSARLQYSRLQNSIHYSGNVLLDSSDAKVWADVMDAFFSSSGDIERATAHGNLRITQAGREVKGSDLEYSVAEGKFVVTGSPVELYGYAKNGKSTGRRLTFFAANDRILLE